MEDIMNLQPTQGTQGTPIQVRGDIGWAIDQMRQGKKVTRIGWNGKGQFLGLQLLDLNSPNTLPYIYIITVDRKRVPWLASQTDILAFDWEIMPVD